MRSPSSRTTSSAPPATANCSTNSQRAGWPAAGSGAAAEAGAAAAAGAGGCCPSGGLAAAAEHQRRLARLVRLACCRGGAALGGAVLRQGRPAVVLRVGRAMMCDRCDGALCQAGFMIAAGCRAQICRLECLQGGKAQGAPVNAPRPGIQNRICLRGPRVQHPQQQRVARVAASWTD